MSSAASSALALVALVLAVLALVLATIANRRWATRPGRAPGRPEASPPGARDPGGEPPGVPERVDRAELAALEEALGALRARVDQLGSRVEAQGAQSERLPGAVEDLGRQVSELAAAAQVPIADPTALRHVALVRYDAFADVGGRLSHSLALLDDTRSGVVLTTLAGKSDVRTYVRTISAGSCEGSLTDEERQAIDAAVGSGQ